MQPLTRPSVTRRVLRAYPELVAVLAAVAIGLSVPAPLRWLSQHQGINIVLIVLVLATALTITVDDVGHVATSKARVAAALVAGSTVLPALAWVVAHIVQAGPLRNGVLTIGLAPCEIASVATVAIAGGQATIAAAVLIGSTVLCVAVAGPILILETGSASVHPGTLILNLTIVVLAPLIVGIWLRATRHVGQGHETTATTTATAAVAVLVALIAAQIHPSRDYFGVLAAAVLFTLGAATLGWLLSRNDSAAVAIPIVLTTSMRDFAIAAAIATSALGSESAAPHGLYGIIVLIWGTTVAGKNRTMSQAAPPAGQPTPN